MPYLKTVLTTVLMATASTAAMAQDECNWSPERAVTYIVPYAPGGGTDAHSRQMATQLEAKFGVPFNIVNRAGGNAVGGHAAIANAAPDGYTIGAVSSEINSMHWVGLTELTYADYTPLGLLDIVPASILVSADSQFEDLSGLLEYAKANPGELTASGTSFGGSWHLALAGMLNAEDIQADAIRWIPSQGAAPALQELIADGVDVVSPALSEGKALIDSGEVRALAYLHDEPMDSLPDVPLSTDLLDSDWTFAAYITASGPKGMDDNIACSYAKAIQEIEETDEWAQFKEARGSILVSRDREELRQFMADGDEALGNTMKAVGLTK